MSVRHWIPVLLFCSIVPWVSALELNSKIASFRIEGAEAACLRFRDHKGTVRYIPPKDWHVTGDQAGLELFAPHLPLARAYLRISRSPVTASDGDSMEGNPDSYKRLAFSQLPRGADSISFISSDTMAPVLRGGAGTAYRYQYRFREQAMTAVTVIWALDRTTHEKLIATFFEPPVDGEMSRARGEFFASLFTWTDEAAE